jgi:hypothetical protein
MHTCPIGICQHPTLNTPTCAPFLCPHPSFGFVCTVFPPCGHITAPPQCPVATGQNCPPPWTINETINQQGQQQQQGPGPAQGGGGATFTPFR